MARLEALKAPIWEQQLEMPAPLLDAIETPVEIQLRGLLQSSPGASALPVEVQIHWSLAAHFEERRDAPFEPVLQGQRTDCS